MGICQKATFPTANCQTVSSKQKVANLFWDFLKIFSEFFECFFEASNFYLQILNSELPNNSKRQKVYQFLYFESVFFFILWIPLLIAFFSHACFWLCLVNLDLETNLIQKMFEFFFKTIFLFLYFSWLCEQILEVKNCYLGSWQLGSWQLDFQSWNLGSWQLYS